MNCTLCEVPLTGGMDTYGDVGSEICYECWLAIEENDFSSWYGMAPHHHNFDLTGSWIGSTVLNELPPIGADGRYEIEPGLFFTPDPEVDGSAGMWEDER